MKNQTDNPDPGGSSKACSVALVHQFQPTPYTCVHACLAMVLGQPVEEVIEKVGMPHGLNQHDLLNALESYQLMHAMTMFGAMWTGWQFATVHSLNVRGGTHKVLVHWDAGKYRVLDPSPKIRYKEDGSDLESWNDVILVRPLNVRPLAPADTQTPNDNGQS